MYRTLNKILEGKAWKTNFVTGDDLARVIEESETPPEVLADEGTFLVVKVLHPTKGELCGVSSTNGANIELQAAGDLIAAA